jgi:hypothetical protein
MKERQSVTAVVAARYRRTGKKYTSNKRFRVRHAN